MIHQAFEERLSLNHGCTGLHYIICFAHPRPTQQKLESFDNKTKHFCIIIIGQIIGRYSDN